MNTNEPIVVTSENLPAHVRKAIEVTIAGHVAYFLAFRFLAASKQSIVLSNTLAGATLFLPAPYGDYNPSAEEVAERLLTRRSLDSVRVIEVDCHFRVITPNEPA